VANSGEGAQVLSTGDPWGNEGVLVGGGGIEGLLSVDP